MSANITRTVGQSSNATSQRAHSGSPYLDDMNRNRNRIVRPIGLVCAAGLMIAACGDDAAEDANASEATDATEVTDDSTSSGEATNGFLGSYTLDDAEFGTQTTVTVSGSIRSIATNALPDHDTGEFPNEGNPNEISAQDLTYEYTTEPIYTGDRSAPRTTGVAVNGVKFEPGTAEAVTCATGGEFRVEALQDVYDLGLDFNNAHVQPSGEYHYHGASGLLAEAYSTDDDLVHVGFAADGFLMYYSKSGAYTSGYDLTTEVRSGTDCVGSGPLGGDTVEVEGTTPDGTFTSDWVWNEANGDLDECNGVEINGTYAYVVTDDYPFVSRCLNGEAAAGGGPGGGQGGGADLTDAAEALGVTIEELEAALGGQPPDLDAAAATLGTTVAELEAVLPAGPNGGGQGGGAGGGQGGDDAAGGDNSLASGPTNVGEHGPLSNADFDSNDEVTREELDTFIDDNPQRDIGLIAFFAESDTNGDDIIDEDELAVVDPATAFNGTDANADGQVSSEEADAYANEEGRTYRAIGLSAFFDLVDTNGDDVADADEIEAAHVSGLLARG